MQLRIENRGDDAVAYLEADEWTAAIALWGANLWRLRHRSGLEILRSPPSLAEYRQKPEVWGIPVLFPPGRIPDGRFALQGRSYRFPVNDAVRKNHLHGILSRRLWTCEGSDGETVSLRFVNSPERDCHAFFPHRVTVRLSYRWHGCAVEQRVAVTNDDEVPMPFGFGFHTVFRLPFGDSGPAGARQCLVKATLADYAWEQVDALPTGERVPLAEDWRQGVRTEGREVFVHAPLVPAANGFRGATIESPCDRAKLIYEVGPEFRHWVLWNYGGDRQLFCPEPQTWMVNAPNLSLPPAISGMAALAPGETWTAISRIALELAAT